MRHLLRRRDAEHRALRRRRRKRILVALFVVIVLAAIMGAATVARLHADEEFIADLEKVKTETKVHSKQETER